MKILSSSLLSVAAGLLISLNVYADKPSEFCLNSFEDAIQFNCEGEAYNQEEKDKGCILPMISILTEEYFKNPNLECFTTKKEKLKDNLSFVPDYIIDSLARSWFEKFKESNDLTDTDIKYLEDNNVYIPY